MVLPRVVDNIIAAGFDVFRAYIQTYSVVKRAILDRLTPLTNKFDLVDIIIIWTIIFIILSTLYSNYVYAKKRGKN